MSDIDSIASNIIKNGKKCTLKIRGSALLDSTTAMTHAQLKADIIVQRLLEQKVPEESMEISVLGNSQVASYIIPKDTVVRMVPLKSGEIVSKDFVRSLPDSTKFAFDNFFQSIEVVLH